MTTRSPGAVGRYFRRPLLEAFAKYSSISLASPPHRISDFIDQVSTFSATVDQAQSSFGYRFCLVILVRQNGHVSPMPRAASRSSGLSTLPGHWISTRALTHISELRRSFCSGTPEKRGDDFSVLQNEEGTAPGYGALWQRRLQSEGYSSSAFSSRPLAGSNPICHRLMQVRHYTVSTVEGGRWMRITGTYVGPLTPLCTRHPFLEGSVRFKSKKKMKKAKAKKREVLQKIKRMRVVSKKSKEDMNPEERLEFRLEKGRKKMELIKQAIAKFPEQQIPPEDPDVEVLTPEQMHYLKKIGYKNKNYVPVGRRGIYGGTVQNIHLHWKKHETVQVEIAGFSKEEIKVMANQLARLSGGVLIDIHQSNVVILYRGRNYQMPKQLIPMKTLDKRKALAKSKLEQSLKALLENDKKVEGELADLRKENELRLSGKLVEGSGQESIRTGKHRKWQPEPKLEDPDEYSEWSFSDDDSNNLSDTSSSSESDFETDSETVHLERGGVVNFETDSEAVHLEGEEAVDFETDSKTVHLERDEAVDFETDSETGHVERDQAIAK